MSPFYQWLLSGGYIIWFYASYAVTIILGVLTIIVLPLIFYKNAPSKKFEKSFLTPTGEFFLNQNLSAFFSQIRLEGTNLVFKMKEGVSKVDFTLAVYVNGKFKKTLFVSDKQPCSGLVVSTKYQMIDSIVVAVNRVNGQKAKQPTFGKMAAKNILWTILAGAAFLVSTIMFGNYYSIYLNEYIINYGWFPQFNILFYIGVLGFLVAPVAIIVETAISKLGGSQK